VTPVELFSLARLRVSIDWPQLAPAVWALRSPVAVAGLHAQCGGAIATDTRWRVYYDPEAVMSFTVGQAATALVHEAWHCLRRHGERAELLAVELKWRAALAAALDCEVDGDMERCHPRPQWPYRVYLPSDLHCRPGLPFENYFEAAKALVGPSLVVRLVGGSSMGGGPRGWERDGASGAGDIEIEVITRAVAASIGAHPGSLPGGWVRWANGVLALPTAPWQQLLAQAVRGALAFVSGANDYTRSAPSRRQGASRVLLPVLRRPRCSVDVVVDTSGSMGEEQLRAALAEVEGIIKATGAGVRLYACDVAVHDGVQRVSRAGGVELRGGGGTDMGVGIAFAERQRPRADALVVLTDGLTGWPTARPAIPRVIVALLGGFAGAGSVPRWARVVEINKGEVAA